MSIASRRMANSLLVPAALIVAAASPACSAYDSTSSGDELTVVAGDSSGIPWETLRRSAWTAPNGSLVVELDMAFADEASLRRYWQAHRAPGRGQELSVNTRVINGIAVDDVWAIPQNVGLTYCVGTGFSSAQMQALLPALDAAAGAWSRMAGVRYLRVTTSGACNANNNEVVFDIQRNATMSAFGVAFFPHESRAVRTLYVGDDAFTTTAGGRTLTGILTHELGHTLGFRHEHVWMDCTSQGVTEQPTEGSDTARHVTDYDEMSVMHYPQCRSPQGGGYALTPLDIEGSMKLYGPAPALIVSAIHPH